MTPRITCTVWSCTSTQDGNWLLVVGNSQLATSVSSPRPREVGSHLYVEKRGSSYILSPEPA